MSSLIEYLFPVETYLGNSFSEVYRVAGNFLSTRSLKGING